MWHSNVGDTDARPVSEDLDQRCAAVLRCRDDLEACTGEIAREAIDDRRMIVGDHTCGRRAIVKGAKRGHTSVVVPRMARPDRHPDVTDVTLSGGLAPRISGCATSWNRGACRAQPGTQPAPSARPPQSHCKAS